MAWRRGTSSNLVALPLPPESTLLDPPFQNFGKGEGALSRFGDEPTQGSNVVGEPTDVIDPFRHLNLLDRFDLVRICFDSALRHKEPEKFARGDTEHTLLRVELEVDFVQILRMFLLNLARAWPCPWF